MNQPLPTRRLPANPDLHQLKRQAKELLEAYRAADPTATAEVNRFYRGANPETFALHDAQLTIARAHGYTSWPNIKAYVDGVTIDRLAEAVRANNLAEVRAILNVRPELIGVVGRNGHTALHHAVLNRLPGMCRLLMQLGANPHNGIYPHTEATTPLVIATERGYDDIAQILREEERRRNSNRPALTPPDELREAFRNGDEAQVLAILERNPDLVHLRAPNDGRSILHYASALLYTRVAAWLLDHGARPDATANDGTTPLDVIGQFANLSADPNAVEQLKALLLARGATLTDRSAVLFGDEAHLRARHAQGALSIAQDDQGWLLRIAVDHNRPDMLKLLLELGLDPDARAQVDGVDQVEFTWGSPLYACTRYGKYDMARILLEHGADPNGQVYASGTPLSEAYGQRDERMIALLEKHGGKSNPSMAGLYRRKDLAERLLAEHGDTPLPDDGFGSGTVAEQLVGGAACGGDPEILALGLARVDWPRGDQRWYGPLTQTLRFWNHGNGPWCHHEWPRSTYLECFRMILARLGPPTARIRYGCTILHMIVTARPQVTAEERSAFAIAALDAGAPLDIRDDLLKSTPLGWAARWNRPELVRLFLSRGADPIEAGAEPWATPRAWAEKKGHREIAALLAPTAPA